MAWFTFGITTFIGVGRTDTVTVEFDPAQTTPSGEIGSAPPAETANNDLSLWGVQYELSGGDDSGCAYTGGNSLCFGDMIGTDGLGLSLLTDPVLSGPLVSGVTLALTFAVPTTVLDFATALGTWLDTSQCAATPQPYSGATDGCPANVVLYAASGTVLSGGTYDWTLPNAALITEGEFAYSGPAVWRAVLTYPGADSSGSEFAIDNLTYQSGTSSSAPEPSSSILLGLVLTAGITCRLLDRRPSVTEQRDRRLGTTSDRSNIAALQPRAQ